MAGEVSNTPIAQKDPIASLMDSINAYSGKTTTSSSTTGPSSSTTKSNITPEQMDALIGAAMAPLSQAAHGAGISPYSDTTLALGRGQVAAEIGAKYAGTTTTESGKTSAQTQTTVQNPITGTAVKSSLAPSLLSALAKSGATNPITAAIAKKAGITGASKAIGDWIEGLGSTPSEAIASGTSGTTSAMQGGFGDTAAIAGNEGSTAAIESLLTPTAAGDIATATSDGAATDAATAAIPDVTPDVSVDTAPDVMPDISTGDSGDVWENVIDWLGFANGGMVNTKKYADGGNVKYVDRFNPMTTVEEASNRSPVIDALFEQMPSKTASGSKTVAGTGKTDPLAAVSTIDAGTTGSADAGTSGAVDGTTSAPSTSSGIGIGINGSSVATAAAIGAVTGGVPGAISAALGNTISQAISGMISAITAPTESPTHDTDTTAIDAQNESDAAAQAVADSVATTAPADSTSTAADSASAATTGDAATGDSSSSTGDGTAGVGGDGGAAAGGDGGAAGASAGGEATGGNIRGPGSATSDSISARLSDGERVITAKTNDAVEKMFPGFFHMLEQEFNPQAAAAQVRKGQA